MCLLIITMRDEFGIVRSCAVGGGRGGHGQGVIMLVYSHSYCGGQVGIGNA